MLFKKKKTKINSDVEKKKKNQLKTHTGALGILLVHSNTGSKREKRATESKKFQHLQALSKPPPSPLISLFLPLYPFLCIF